MTKPFPTCPHCGYTEYLWWEIPGLVDDNDVVHRQCEGPRCEETYRIALTVKLAPNRLTQWTGQFGPWRTFVSEKLQKNL